MVEDGAHWAIERLKAVKQVLGSSASVTAVLLNAYAKMEVANAGEFVRKCLAK